MSRRDITRRRFGAAITTVLAVGVAGCANPGDETETDAGGVGATTTEEDEEETTTEEGEGETTTEEGEGETTEEETTTTEEA